MSNETGLPTGIEKDSQEHVDWLNEERVEIVAPWPGMPKWYNNGTVLTDDGNKVTMVHIPGSMAGYKSDFSEVHKMPHLFRPLAWWEKRSPEQMPGCVKMASKDISSIRVGEILKCEICLFDEKTIEVLNPSASHHYVEIERKTGLLRFNLSHFVPATRAEYEAQQSTNDK